MYVYNNIYFVQRILVHFIKRNYIQNGQYVMLNVGDRSWEVRFVISGKVQGSFSAGWASFAKENNPQVGDTCVFELIKRDDVMLKDSIFRHCLS